MEQVSVVNITNETSWQVALANRLRRVGRIILQLLTIEFVGSFKNSINAFLFGNFEVVVKSMNFI